MTKAKTRRYSGLISPLSYFIDILIINFLLESKIKITKKNKIIESKNGLIVFNFSKKSGHTKTSKGGTIKLVALQYI